MPEMFVVQSDWPLPGINRSPKGARRKYPLETTAVGSMFFVPGRTSKSVSAYISRISKNVPGKFSARHAWAVQRDDGTWAETTKGEPGAVEGTGVWRVE